MHSKYFEEFNVGDEFKSRRISLSEGQIMDFALMYDPQHMHVDHERSEEGPFKGIIASGFQTMSLSFRLFYELGLVAETNIIGGGCDNIRWVKPHYPGQPIYIVAEVLKKRASVSKKDRGILTWKLHTFDSKDDLMMHFEMTMIVKRRDVS